MGISTLVTLATFLPLLFRFGLTAPLPEGDTTIYSPSSLYPDPYPCSGNNSGIHDPSIMYEDGTYWRFSTSGNIAVATAPSMKGPWMYQGPLLPQGTKIHVADGQDIWAPSISKFGDQYYIHYSVSTMGSQASQIGVATAPSLSGPWKDQGSLNLPQHSSYNLIDPYVFQDLPGDTLYFTFGSYWSGIQQFSLPSHEYLMAVDSGLGRVDDIHPIVANTSDAAAVVEGGITFKNDKYYYLFFSVGLCCNTPKSGVAPPGDEYRVAVCRAEKVTGPYVDRDGRDCRQTGGSTILASHGDVYAPGGQGVMKMEDGSDAMYYHYVRPSIGYEASQFFFGWNYLEWRDGWPVVV